MTTQRNRMMLLILLGVALALFVLALLWWLSRTPGSESPTEGPAVELPTQPVRDTTSSDVLVPATPEQASAQIVARTFAERFGSYSTDANFSNIYDVADLTTPAYQAQLEAGIHGAAAGSAYQGVTVRALTTPVVVSGSETEGRVVYQLSVQKEVTDGGGGVPQLSYPVAQLTLVRSGETWLVEAFSWKTE